MDQRPTTLPPKNLVFLGVAEGLVMLSAVLRLVIGGLDLGRPPQLVWFVAVVMLAGAGIAQYVVRATLLLPRLRAGERIDDELRQLLAMSLAIIGLAGLLSLVGPQPFERLMG
ncbi:MAG: hypothetical protein ACOZQL_38375 [Myxococcota bacterium]